MQHRLPPDQFLSTCKSLEAVARCGPISMASIARQAGLTPQATADAISELLARGWVRETGNRGTSAAGQRCPIYEAAPDAAAIAVADLGGTNVRTAISDLSGTIRSQRQATTDPRGGRHVVRQIASLCRESAERLGVPFSHVRIAVVGVPGVPDRHTGRVRMAPNIRGLDSFDVRSALREALGVEAILENDVNAALLGEHWAGGSQDIDDLVYVKVGTGIGAGILCNGAVVRGFKGAGGQISAIPLGADPEEPESLRAGALERVTAGAGIRSRFRALTGRDAEVATIFARSADGDAAASLALEEAAGHLARALGATCAMIDPERIILGGSIGCRQEFVDRVSAALARIHPAPAPIIPETPDFEAALLGCTHLGLENLSASLLLGDIVESAASEPT